MQSHDPASETHSGASGDTLFGSAERYAREEPAKAVGGAFVVGLFLTLLPVGAIAAALVRLAITLVRPALFVLGAVKLYEEIDRKNR